MLFGVLPKIEYLDFMARWSGQVRCDLASSGITPLNAADLGMVAPDEFSSRERFVAAIARHYGVAETDVVPCLGTSGALLTACLAFLTRGDAALVERPAYEPLWRIVQALGYPVDAFDRTAGSGFQVSVDAVLAALAPNTRLVVVTNPHNPTAALTPDAELLALARELAKRNARLLVDEVYLESARPQQSLHRADSSILTCSSITKCWGVPWARAGWLLVPRALAADAIRAERYTVGSAPPASWAWGALAFERHFELRARAEKLQAGKRTVVDAFVARNAERLSWCPPPPSSPFGWLRTHSGRPLAAMLERLVETEGVLVAPGEFFGDECALRLAWTSPLPTLERGLTLLEQALSEYEPS